MFFADLHIHSRFSMSTSKQLNLDTLSYWGKKKGLSLLGTGDCTHAQWLKELKENLIFDEESGFYKYEGLHYVLQGEISCIYKKNGRTRRVHHTVFLPNFQGAEKLGKKLEQIGNIHHDGRPILKLDSKHLLEMILEIPNAFLIPAHVWTPWYSLFGEKSGFDSVEECFEELTPYIFAMETGLSSDVRMNRLCNQLNKYAFISNSDAHSPGNLAREANVFEGKLTYEDFFKSLHYETREKAGCRFLGTVEMYPQLGKYYTSGHKDCNCSLKEGEKTKICPVCHKKLTQGVYQRVQDFSALAQQNQGKEEIFPQKEWYCVPLLSLLSSVLGKGENTQKVQTSYFKLLENTTELDLLLNVPIEDIDVLLQKSISGMRSGQVIIEPGYDGVYGKVTP